MPTSDGGIDHDQGGVLQHVAFAKLDSLGLKEILDQDSRPTLIIDLNPDYVVEDKHAIVPVFVNTALRHHDQLLGTLMGGLEDSVKADSDATTYSEFRDWVTRVSRCNDSTDIFPLALQFRNLLWTASTIRQRWRLISGIALYQTSSCMEKDLPLRPSPRRNASWHEPEISPDPKSQVPVGGPTWGVVPDAQQSKTPMITLGKDTSKPNTRNDSSIIPMAPDVVSDWTVSSPVGILSDHIQFTREVDWANTPMGAMEEWSPQFREIANLLMRNPHPAALFWGEDLTMMYNEAYKDEIAGSKHPELMGTGFSGPFAELWEELGPIMRECGQTGISIRKENDLQPIVRYGYLEECFFSWSFVPLFGGTDRIQGFWNAPFETTNNTISHRRMQMLQHLGEHLNATRTVKQFWERVLDGLEPYQYDVPFALLYSISDADDADTASQSSGSAVTLKSCFLEGSIGIPTGHPASPQKLDLKRSQEGFIPAFREAMRTREPTILQTIDGTLPKSLLEDIMWRGYGDPCKEAIIFPVRPTNGENVFAFLLVGVNPRRAYDDEYKSFVAMLNRQLATSLASVLLFEDEVRMSQNAADFAAQQREQLSHQLELQTSRMRRMTELSPLGMYFFNPEGVLVEANERYYEMTGRPRGVDNEPSITKHLAEDSRGLAQEMWDEMMTTLKPLTREMQLYNPKAQPRDLNGQPIDYWVLASSQPEIGPDGKVMSIMGSITDISHMKWAQGLQETRLREAEETKRQQNEFIDITSHEMRNPLSAILICADSIRDTLTQHKFTGDAQQFVTECVEAANNIALCAQHQKSIVDDILTVSKLDSNLLLITPIPVQPIAVVQRAMKMFEHEVQAKDIEFSLIPHQSIQREAIDWVLLDPSRLLQITVNLITNAIKFTTNSHKRSISVRVSASPVQPDLPTKGFQFVSTRGKPINVTTGNDWGPGPVSYLSVDVEDTGCGLSVEEKERLFERFTQASPRTHAHYGGSGLGLFISRQLAELHGGQIGVSSEAGVGSTFGFFLQCKRTVPHDSETTPPQNPSRAPQTPNRIESSRELVAAVSHVNIKKPEPAMPHYTNLNELHVLIVEDNILNQKILAKQLTKAGCHVSTADDGLLALNHLNKTHFHVAGGIPLSIILMDLEMPVMDGLTCCKRIREMEKDSQLSRHVPIIAVTANVRSEQITTAREVGMDDVLGKPYRIPELLAKVQILLEKLSKK